MTSITNNINTARSQSFTYDELNRVITAKTQAATGTYAWGLSFGYDTWANLLSASVTQGSAYTLSVAVTGKNQLISSDGFAYDAAGNMTADPVNSYTFNAEGELTSAAGVTYTYDGDGDRVKKSSGKLYWYGVGTDPLSESDASGNLTAEYIFLGGARIAMLDLSTSTVNYYVADNLGSSRVVTNSSGTVLDDSDFYPFGGERSYSSSSGNNYKFTGKERDSESGLDDFTARFYTSNYGRFISADDSKYMVAADPQTFNLYSYVANNPINSVDPTGHAPNKLHPVDEFEGGDPADSERSDADYQAGLDYVNWCTNNNGECKADEDAEAAAKQQKQKSAQDLANEIPQEVKEAIKASLEASDSPTDDFNDSFGGYHEESGLAGTDAAGKLVISPDIPGPEGNPDNTEHLHTSQQAADQDVRNRITTPTVSWHIHPKGNTGTHGWKQPPSPADHTEVIANTISIVVGSGNRTVYFYDSSSRVVHMSFDKFMKEPKK